MITSIITGGLGNQMIQYSIGRSFALKFGVRFRLDLSMYAIFGSRPWMREYELTNVFSFPDVVEFSNSNILKKAELIYLLNRSDKPDCRLFNRMANIVCVSDMMDCSQRINKHTMIYGLDHSIRYFEDYLPQLRKDFTFKNPLIGQNKALCEKIMSSNSLSIHVRRGDYLNSANINEYAHIDVDWYFNAIETIKNIVGEVSLFVFSDDIPWCRTAFEKYDEATFVDWNVGSDSYRDMQLMSLCKHNIVANSSFSRMAAMLNCNPEQIVICPQNYSADENDNKKYFIKLPKNWIVQ